VNAVAEAAVQGMPRFCRRTGSTPTNLSVSAFYLPKVNVGTPRNADRLESRKYAGMRQARYDQTGCTAEPAATNNSFELWKINRGKQLRIFRKNTLPKADTI
jgi:hypothetical protein